MISDSEKLAAEAQIVDEAKVVDYDTKEYPVEVVVQKYLNGLSDGDNELFIPDYQRAHVWDKIRQSKFIESVLIGLPLPYIFVADIKGGDGRLEIVDGSQRVRTLADFMQGNLQLEGLKKLTKLIGFKFSDLPLSRQRRFRQRTLRMIALNEKADEKIRRDIFERINTGSDALRPMEVRRGLNSGPLLWLLEECARNPLFHRLAPLAANSEKRRERDELVLRFFAYLDGYQKFPRKVEEFLDVYVERHSSLSSTQASQMKAEFEAMLDFVDRFIPNGFLKAAGHKRTFHNRFDAIAVGVALALRINPSLIPKTVAWTTQSNFMKLTTSGSSNSRTKIIARIEFARDNLLA